MLPYNAIFSPLFWAQSLLFIPVMIFTGLTLRQQHLEKTRVRTRAPFLSDRSKIELFRSARSFFIGALLALGAANLFLTHEHARFSHRRFIELPLTSTNATTNFITAATKVR